MHQSVNTTNLWYKLTNTTRSQSKPLLLYLRVLLHLGNQFLQKMKKYKSQ